jgi:hypothetical protein
VVDEVEAKLVILGPDSPHSAKTDSSAARHLAAEILNRGSAGRNCGNMLVFLAADKTRLVDLDKAVRSYMAWKSIDDDKKPLNLDTFQTDQVERRLVAADKAVTGRIPETYVWLLVAGQKRPEPGQPFPPVEWQEFRLQGQEWLAERASKKLRNDGLLVTSMAGTILRHEIDQVPLWRGDHVGVKQLVDDFAKYLYLPRVKNAQVILDAIQDGVSLFTWAQQTFAYADFQDAASGQYRGLDPGRRQNVRLDATSLVVKPESAAAQLEREAAAVAPSPIPPASSGADPSPIPISNNPEPRKITLRRFHGAVKIDATRLSRDVDQIAGAIVQHLGGLLGAKLTITLEIDAEIPSGAPDNVVRTVTENCRTLKFDNSGFEES